MLTDDPSKEGIEALLPWWHMLSIEEKENDQEQEGSNNGMHRRWFTFNDFSVAPTDLATTVLDLTFH